jgi:tRNA (cytidine/uridine-2'-O-)-methyltransferase
LVDFTKSAVVGSHSRAVKLKAVFNIVLYQPENPHNTGGIARTCALFAAKLHLIQPLGFPYPNRDLRRTSMDYLEAATPTLHASWDAFAVTLEQRSRGDAARVWLFTDTGSEVYSRAEFQPGDYLVFGRESDGLPASILESFPGLRIPMPGAVKGPREDHRFHSLNVSISVGIALSEATRQITSNWDQS